MRRLALILVAPLCLWGCATTIVPPGAVVEPARIGLLDHGRHASLIVETPDAAMVRYAYGEWQWFALRETGAVEASAAVLWPTRAALGRKRLPGPFSPEAVLREVRAGIEHAVYFEVEARDLRRLVDRLDAIYAENSALRIYNEAYDLYFVPHPDAYWAFHNSNQVMAEWIEALGGRVEGSALFSVWALDERER